MAFHQVDRRENEISATLQVPEVQQATASGRWMIPAGGILVVGLGAHAAGHGTEFRHLVERVLLIDGGDVPASAFVRRLKLPGLGGWKDSRDSRNSRWSPLLPSLRQCWEWPFSPVGLSAASIPGRGDGVRGEHRRSRIRLSDPITRMHSPSIGPVLLIRPKRVATAPAPRLNGGILPPSPMRCS